MDDKTQQLIEQLKSNPAFMQALLMSRDGQELMRLLTKDDHGASLQSAMNSAMHGNVSDLMQLVNKLKESPEGAEIIDRINKAAQK